MLVANGYVHNYMCNIYTYNTYVYTGLNLRNEK